jgi:lipopolysaccharide biosynthesis glycosyltransferase
MKYIIQNTPPWVDGSKAERVNVFLCIGSNYWPHAAVVLSSLARYSSNVDVWLFYETLSWRWQRKIRNLLVHSGSTVTFVPFDITIIRGLKECGHLGLSAYYRLFVPDLLPEHLQRIVYLDADLIVRRSIEELYFQPLDDAVVGAVSGPAAECYVRDAARLGLPSGSEYFNSGVLVINLRRWRQLGIRDQSLQFMQDHPDKVVYADQDLLNATLYLRYKSLPPMWNVTLELFRSLPSSRGPDHSEGDLDLPVVEPAIVHFNGQYKPWHLRYRHPFKYEYVTLRRKLQLRPYVSDDLCSLPLMRLRQGFTQLITRLGTS